MSEFRRSSTPGPGRGHRGPIRQSIVRKGPGHAHKTCPCCVDVRVEQAAQDGYALGRRNAHWTSKTYSTSAEYFAWLAGWRRGQAERRRLAA